MQRQPTFLCLASYYKGYAFMEEAKSQGCRVILLTTEKLRDENWPRHALDEIFFLPALNRFPEIVNAVTYLARDRQIDFINPLDDYDVETAARLREHLRIPGMGDTTARHFRDKLAMRVQARDNDIHIPDFVHVLNHAKVHEFTQRVAPPWVLKPRSEAGSIGIKKLNNVDDLWEVINAMGDVQSYYLLEQFVAGDIYHVDSIVYKGKLLFAQAHRYGTPPFSLWNYGGVFSTRSLDAADPILKDMLPLNEKVIKAMGLVRGVTHAEYIHCKRTGQLHFLELAARVGGANIDILLDRTTGVNLWREWVRLELAYLNRTDYNPPKRRYDQGGLLLCLSKDEHPDLSSYDAPEVAWKLDRPHHAGLVVVSPDSQRAHQLLDQYDVQLQRDFLAIEPPTEAAV